MIGSRQADFQRDTSRVELFEKFMIIVIQLKKAYEQALGFTCSGWRIRVDLALLIGTGEGTYR